MESQTASARAMPVLDEATFQQILEAAYVLQEQNEIEDEIEPVCGPKLNPAETLAEIAATQQVLHSKQYDVPTSARLIAEQLQKITHASGVAIAVIKEDRLEYCAAVGSAAALAGLNIPIDESLSNFLQMDKAELRRASEFLQSHESNSPVLFPVYHDGKVAGLLDLRFEESVSIREHEIGSCQVMAGLMSEAIAREARLEWKHALATERATMLEVLERLRPQLERLAAEPTEAGAAEPVTEIKAISPAPEEVVIQQPPPASELEALVSAIGDADQKTSAISACAQCGYRFGEGELFCGRCGTPRSMEMVLLADREEESAFPELAPEQPAGKAAEEPGPPAENSTTNLHSISDAPLPPELEQALAQFSRAEVPQTDGSSALAIEREEFGPMIAEEAKETEPPEPEAKPEIVPPAKEPQTTTPAPWASATRTLKWLKSLEKTDSPGRLWLGKHRGDISVAVSALILLLALAGVGSRTVKHRPNSPSQPTLTLFERMLVGLGLAEAPPASVTRGNPNVMVWVDVHTALYYCPGAELYGKTPDGKIEAQRDAQLDQFEPAAGENCR